MAKHLFGLIVTHYGTAANNRGETEGNITTLQKILWKDEVHTTVSAEAIRWGIRWYWQQLKGEKVLNRSWNDEAWCHEWKDADFTKWDTYLDDDILGFMSAKAGKEEANEAEQAKGKKKSRIRGTCDKRRARLEVTRAISLTPFAGDITFNSASPGATPSASSTGKDPVPYGTEVHATRYQYAFALTPEELSVKERVLDVVDAIIGLSEVAGNQARFLFDFSPESIIFRWTEDFAPRILYGFALDSSGRLMCPEIIHRIEAKDIDPEELIIGGSFAENEEIKKAQGGRAFLKNGVKAAAAEVKMRIKNDLGLP